ncbi:type II CAAX endopeptidase family protein [Chitinophaga sancti]|uniref:CPBP family intramembrane glutamic endopeptidase n=1 Tax=Chitinophaga sancti TaxID=1004 RepID=UPI002A7504E3|nr:type II CAAX endopeptidase family protein [Chitinophaga sancti]WPQ62656.1 type II CAAX endopeptidase family protein [Chitinophaga sancti]
MDHQAYPELKSLLKLFLMLLLFMIIIGLIGGFYVGFSKTPLDPLTKSFINLISYTAAMIATIWYAARLSKKEQPESFELGFNKIQLWLIPLLIISTIALTVGLERVSSLVPMPDSVAEFFDDLFKNDIFSIIMISVVAPILEETLCRGIVLKGLLQNYSPRKAILYSALFFALIHLNPWQSLPAFFAGLFLGWVYYKTRSVIPGIIVHAVSNTTFVLFLFLPKAQQDYLGLLGLPLYLVVCVLAIIVFVAGCMLIQKRAKVV